jgi:hypothetical protein
MRSLQALRATPVCGLTGIGVVVLFSTLVVASAVASVVILWVGHRALMDATPSSTDSEDTSVA